MSIETIGGGRADESQQSEGVVEALLRIASTAQFFRSADGRFHAQVPIGDRYEIYGLKSTAFGDWLIDSYRRERGRAAAGGRGEERRHVAGGSRDSIAACRRCMCEWGATANRRRGIFTSTWETRAAGR